MGKMVQKLRIYILPIISILLIVGLLLQPTECIAGAKNGLLLWFNTVLPSLLPFIIGANVLLASGSLYYFEKLFQPIMKPLFNVPGCSAFAWIIGLISGYPMGAKITAQLKENNQITDVEAQRLLSFCNNSGPFFILGAVGVGMLHNEGMGYFLLLVHFLSSLSIGIIFRFYGKDQKKQLVSKPSFFTPAISIGEVIGTSVASGMEVIVQIGGYIIIFSVIGSLLRQTHFIQSIANTLSFILSPLGITKEMSLSWIIGVIEMSNGIHMVAMMEETLQIKLAVISFLLSWSGFSIHAQSIHLIRHTSIKISIYLFAKLIQSSIAFILSLLLFPIYNNHMQQTIATFSPSYYRYFPTFGILFIIFIFVVSIASIQKHKKAR